MNSKAMKIDTVDFARLASGDAAEVKRLFDASQSPGFFYLNLQGHHLGERLLADLSGIYSVTQKYFDQVGNQKTKDYRSDQKPSQDRGYKRSPCDETFEMAYDELVLENRPLPEILEERKELLERFSENCHSVCLALLSHLSQELQLDGSHSLENFHRKFFASDSGLKLIYEPSLERAADVSDNTHTDSGTFTFLFYDGLGLKAKSPNDGNWAFIAPKAGCALINPGDTLQRLSGQRIHSPTHKVTQPFDGFEKRYFISYFLRPEHRLNNLQVEGNFV